MSKNTKFSKGQTHVFTNNSGSDTIYLKAGPGETLNISAAVSNTLIDPTVLVETVTSGTDSNMFNQIQYYQTSAQQSSGQYIGGVQWYDEDTSQLFQPGSAYATGNYGACANDLYVQDFSTATTIDNNIAYLGMQFSNISKRKPDYTVSWNYSTDSQAALEAREQSYYLMCGSQALYSGTCPAPTYDSLVSGLYWGSITTDYGAQTVQKVSIYKKWINFTYNNVSSFMKIVPLMNKPTTDISVYTKLVDSVNASSGNKLYINTVDVWGTSGLDIVNAGVSPNFDAYRIASYNNDIGDSAAGLAIDGDDGTILTSDSEVETSGYPLFLKLTSNVSYDIFVQSVSVQSTTNVQMVYIDDLLTRNANTTGGVSAAEQTNQFAVDPTSYNNSAFVITASGYYKFIAYIAYSGSGTTEFRVCKNTSSGLFQRIGESFAGNTAHDTGAVYLDVGDKVGVLIDTPVTGDLLDLTTSYFSMYHTESLTEKSSNDYGSINTASLVAIGEIELGSAITQDCVMDGRNIYIGEDCDVLNLGSLARNQVNLGDTCPLVNIADSTTLLNIGSEAGTMNVGSQAGTMYVGYNATTLNIGTYSATNMTVGAIPFTSGLFMGMAYLRDEKTSGTHGGSAVNTGWTTRVLNTSSTYGIITVSLSSNQISLGAGKYFIWASMPAYKVNQYQGRIYDATGATALFYGSSGMSYDNGGNTVSNRSIMSGFLSPTSTNLYEIQYFCQKSQATVGLGNYASVGGTEVYTQVWILKLY